MIWNYSEALPGMVKWKVTSEYICSSLAYNIFGAWVYSYHMPSFSAAVIQKDPLELLREYGRNPGLPKIKTAQLNLICKLALRMQCSWSWLPNLSTASYTVTCQCYHIVILRACIAREVVCFLCFCGVILSRWTEAWERLPNEVVMMAKETWT